MMKVSAQRNLNMSFRMYMSHQKLRIYHRIELFIMLMYKLPQIQMVVFATILNILIPCKITYACSCHFLALPQMEYFHPDVFQLLARFYSTVESPNQCIFTSGSKHPGMYTSFVPRAKIKSHRNKTSQPVHWKGLYQESLHFSFLDFIRLYHCLWHCSYS